MELSQGAPLGGEGGRELAGIAGLCEFLVVPDSFFFCFFPLSPQLYRPRIEKGGL